MMPGTFSKFFLQVLVKNGMGNAFKPATSRVKLLQKTMWIFLVFLLQTGEFCHEGVSIVYSFSKNLLGMEK